MLNYPEYNQDFLSYDQKEPMKEKMAYDFPMMKISSSEALPDTFVRIPQNMSMNDGVTNENFNYSSRQDKDNWLSSNKNWILSGIAVIIIIVIIVMFMMMKNKSKTVYF